MFQTSRLLLSLNFHRILPTNSGQKQREGSMLGRTVDGMIQKKKANDWDFTISKLNKLGGEKLWGCWNFKWTGVMPSSISVGVACCVIEQVLKKRETYWQLNINERFNVVEGTKHYQYSVLIRVRRERSRACVQLGQRNYIRSHGHCQPFNKNHVPG